MKTLPSKELLSAVLGEDFNIIGNIVDICASENTVNIRIELDGIIKKKSKNIYELIHLMKEWALKQELVHSIDIYHDEIGIHTEIVGRCKQSGESGCTLYSNISTDIIESTTDYCEWILKEISK